MIIESKVVVIWAEPTLSGFSPKSFGYTPSNSSCLEYSSYHVPRVTCYL